MACTLAPSERAAFLNKACGTDTELRELLERRMSTRVLAHHDTVPRDTSEPGPVFARVDTAHTIGRFAVLRQIGKGGMGEVWLAYDEALNRKVAIKLLQPKSNHGHGRTRLTREAQAMAQLSHPNVAAVHEVGAVGDRVFIAMEYIDGPTLGEWCQDESRTSLNILDMYLQSGRGLSAAHHAGLIHRDFKPSNVIVGHSGRARVLDFGLARLDGDSIADRADVAAHNITETQALSQSLTMEGMMMGTPLYMSPEQYRGDSVDARSDQFNFCVALYEAMFDVPPFTSESLWLNRTAKEQGDIARPAVLDPELESLRKIIVRGLATHPDERWSSMDELIERLVAHRDSRDLAVSFRQSLMFLGFFAGTTVVSALVVWSLVDDLTRLKPRDTIVIAIGILAIISVPMVFMRRLWMDNLFIRKLIYSGLATIVVLIVHRIVSVPLDTSVHYILVGDLLLMTSSSAICAITLSPWMWLVSLLFFALAAIAALHPLAATLCITMGPSALIPLGIVLWRRSRESSQPYRRDRRVPEHALVTKSRDGDV